MEARGNHQSAPLVIACVRMGCVCSWCSYAVHTFLRLPPRLLSMPAMQACAAWDLGH